MSPPKRVFFPICFQTNWVFPHVSLQKLSYFPLFSAFPPTTTPFFPLKTSVENSVIEALGFSAEALWPVMKVMEPIQWLNKAKRAWESVRWFWVRKRWLGVLDQVELSCRPWTKIWCVFVHHAYEWWFIISELFNSKWWFSIAMWQITRG